MSDPARPRQTPRANRYEASISFRITSSSASSRGPKIITAVGGMDRPSDLVVTHHLLDIGDMTHAQRRKVVQR